MPIRAVVGGELELKTERMRRREAARPSDGAFARHLQSGGATSPAQATAVIATPLLYSLLDAQEVDAAPDAGSGQRRRAAVQQHATGLLERLDELRHDLLQGRLSGQRLERLSHLLQQGRERSGDAGLDAVVDAIETRLEVELAKYSRR